MILKIKCRGIRQSRIPVLESKLSIERLSFQSRLKSREAPQTELECFQNQLIWLIQRSAFPTIIVRLSKSRL